MLGTVRHISFFYFHLTVFLHGMGCIRRGKKKKEHGIMVPPRQLRHIVKQMADASAGSRSWSMDSVDSDSGVSSWTLHIWWQRLNREKRGIHDTETPNNFVQLQSGQLG